MPNTDADEFMLVSIVDVEQFTAVGLVESL